MNRIIAILFVICVTRACGTQLPSEITKCRGGDTDCIQKAFNEVLNNHSDGFPAINLPTIDPLRVNTLDITEDGERPINIKLHFRNIDYVGLKYGKVTKIRGFDRDPKNSKFEIHVLIPSFKMLSDYEIKGRVLVLPIEGRGRANLTAENAEIQAKFQPKVTYKNGKAFIQIEDKFKLNFDTTRLHVSLENLFNGDKALGDNMNLFLNENWRDILDELKPAYNDAMRQVLISYLNRIFKTLSYDDVWLD